MVFGFLFLCQFAENNGFQIFPCPCEGHELILFNDYIVFHVVYVPHFLYPVHHGPLHVFATVTRTVMNMQMYVLYGRTIYFPFGYVASKGTARSNSTVLGSWRNLQTAFHSD